MPSPDGRHVSRLDSAKAPESGIKRRWRWLSILRSPRRRVIRGGINQADRVAGTSRYRSDGFSIVTIVLAGTLLVTETPAADHAMHSDDRLAAKYRSVGIDHDLALDRRMPLRASNQIAVGIVVEADGAEGDTLVKGHMVGNHAGLSNHHACAMIDEETRADPRPGMNVDSGAAMGPFCHHAWNQRDAQRMQTVGESIDRDRFEAGIAKDDFVVPMRGGVAVKCRLDIGGDEDAKLWDILQEGQGLFASPLVGVVVVPIFARV